MTVSNESRWIGIEEFAGFAGTGIESLVRLILEIQGRFVLSGSFRCSVFDLAASAAELLSPLLSFYLRC